jgi:Fanconi-associated nuclease 1
VSRALRRSWAPERPLLAPQRRSVRLLAAPPGPRRPRWRGKDAPEPVEQAVCSWLGSLGRRAVHAEGTPWSTLFALLFAPTYFLPVPGALPVRFLAGPLDLGTPAFRARRADAVDAVLAAVDRGEAPALVADAWGEWHGARLAGARWDGLDRELLCELAAGMGPAGLRAVLEPLLDGGSRAAAGLPDLVVLPGEPLRLPDAHPSRLPAGLLLAEVKGPTDSLRDGQRVWLDRLARAGVPVELWEVSAPPSS